MPNDNVIYLYSLPPDKTFRGKYLVNQQRSTLYYYYVKKIHVSTKH